MSEDSGECCTTDSYVFLSLFLEVTEVQLQVTDSLKVESWQL